MFSIIFGVLCLLPSVILVSVVPSNQDSFSFFKFRGPVSGVAEKIVVSDSFDPNGRRVDYLAKPDYFFHYGVQDTKTSNSQEHKQARDGDAVLGEYRVLQDDGFVRIVRYIADPQQGFRATIEYAKLKVQ